MRVKVDGITVESDILDIENSHVARHNDKNVNPEDFIQPTTENGIKKANFTYRQSACRSFAKSM